MYGRLRRRCQSVIDELSLPEFESVEALCRHLAQRRGRPLRLHPLPTSGTPAGVCGAWVATSTADYIFVERQTVRLHQEHITLHEIGHMLFDHRPLDPIDTDGMAVLLRDLRPERVQRVLARTSYSTRQEREAEMFASLVRASGGNPADPPPAGVLGGLATGLGFRRDG
ncbi:hypothetical protein SAMN05421810_10936 [Amycolatopsis arida]|uniref:IrrE N-terminal-like domain-containing protein n=1 Tax=Amycolatopsis arida TaxID=587909 RepID=A0A1I5ZCK5_9PSEU|nr:hypothetical protein [Amycolatopsis arida]TDX89515.1 hypothetical protein CLV69_10935 [Amycolatopsis arida]SFQ54098.1 hypothetical protein SAMN05421810_10936 [Amycolatopsis arida]